MKRPPVTKAASATRLATEPDARDWIPVSTAYPLARVGKRRLLEAIAAGELDSRQVGRSTQVRRDELEQWAPRPIHLTEVERLAEISRAADLYAKLSNVRQVAEQLQRSPNTIIRYLDDAGLARTMGPDSKYAQPEPRECAWRDCDRVFTPEGWRVAEGHGAYCSEECRRKWFVDSFSLRPVYPEPGARPCEHCGTIFTPTRANAGRGHGKCCSRTCSALNRWRHGRGLLTLVRRGPLFSGRSRQRWLGRWLGAPAGAAGGRPPSYSRAQADEVLELKTKHPDWGRVTLARRTGLTEDQSPRHRPKGLAPADLQGFSRLSRG